MRILKIEILLKVFFRILFLCAVTAQLQAQIALAKDFGTRGAVTHIEEQAFLEMIKERLEKVDIKEQQKQMQALARDRVENPRPVEGISSAEEDRVFYFDPSYVLDRDAVLPCGKILYKAGTKVNPLEHMDLNRRMFFIDSRDETQVAWLKTQLNRIWPGQENIIEDRVILVGGKPFELQEELKEEGIEMNIYFDQFGELTKKFGIKHSPASLEQDGLRIRINEISLVENNLETKQIKNQSGIKTEAK